jgi:transposase
MSSQKGEDTMISKEDFVKIETLASRGMYHTDIARELGISEKTVRRALARGSAPKRAWPKRGSKLEPFKVKVDELLATGVWNAVVIQREIEALGYTGKSTVLRDYIQPKRALRASRVTVRFETEPGVQMQSDWGQVTTEIGGQAVEVHFCANTLGYSRRFHFWCTDCEDAEHTYEGLLRSFEYFGGVTKEVLLDNQKAAVLRHTNDQGVRFQERFLDFAEYCGFNPRACKPYRARTKGKDERMVGYIKGHFFVRYRSFESWAHLNQLAEHWLGEEADARVHGTVNEVVADRFKRESPHLKILPARRYDTSYRELRVVNWDGYIEVRGNRYSVPSELAGSTVVVRIGLYGDVQMYSGDALVAQHRLRPLSEGWVTVADHHRRLWQDTLNTAHAHTVEQRSLAVYAQVVHADQTAQIAQEAPSWN